MAFIRDRPRGDGTTTYAVIFTLKRPAGPDGKVPRPRQSSLPFATRKAAEAFLAAVNVHGAERALEMYGADPAPRRAANAPMTVADWISHHIDHLSGVDKRTVDDYRSYLRTSIAPTVGTVPLTALSRDDVARWVQGMTGAAKTIANKHALLSAALNAAVKAGHIPNNPAAGARLPRSEKGEMVFLTAEQYAALIAEIPEHWQPLVEFLVASGCRWGEATALRPADVNRDTGTIRISRAWQKNPYRLGPPKTNRSRRTITIDATVLDQLHYDGDWLFTNPGVGNRAKGGPVRAPNFRSNVWAPAITRAKISPRPRIHDLRHTCASWMLIAGTPPHVVQRHLGHESIKTTVDTYGPYLDRGSAQAAAAVIAAALRR